MRLTAVDVGAHREAAVLAPERLEETGGGLEAVVGGHEDAVSAAGGLGNEGHAVDRAEAGGVKYGAGGRCEGVGVGGGRKVCSDVHRVNPGSGPRGAARPGFPEGGSGMNDEEDGAALSGATPAVRIVVVALVLRRGHQSRCWSARGAVAAVVVHVGGGTAGMPAGVGVGVVGAGSAPLPPLGRLRAPRPWSG